MMEIIALPGKLLIEPTLVSDIRGEELKSRTGLELMRPDNKTSTFEGIPNRGRIYALPDDYDGELKVGQIVIFGHDAPTGVRIDDKVLFPMEIEKVKGIITDGS